MFNNLPRPMEPDARTKPHNELLIFAKAPRPGCVKTRLAETLGHEAACEAYKTLLRTTGNRLREIPAATLCVWPDDGASELAEFFPASWRFEPQRGGDLGQRLHHAIIAAFERGAASVVVIGCDCPYVCAEDIHAAWALLQKSDVVFGPANDGGYWLAGTRQPRIELFSGVAWGSERVLEQSLQKARELGLDISLLRMLSDVDTAEDWAEFLAAVRQG